jgi:hypothetical protein
MGDCDGDDDGNGNGNGVGVGDGNGNAKEMATARVTMKEGLPFHVAAMCRAFGQGTPCLHPHGHRESSFTNAASWG